MELSIPPGSVDIQTFQFKFQNKIQIFNSPDFLPNGPCALIAVASNSGLLFVALPSKKLSVFHLKDVVEHKDDNCQSRSIPLSSMPQFLAINCNHEVLAVVLCKNSSIVTIFYDVKSFSAEEPVIIQEIRLNSYPDIAVTSIQWNPCIPNMVALCTSDGNLSVYELKQSSVVLQTIQSSARCLCWSPKGKQLVTGNVDGTLSQYKPDLTLVKNVTAPKIFGHQFQCIAIHWITNYQFCAVYSNPNDIDSRPCVAIVNTPKGGSISCLNYEDICYSAGNKLPVYYYLLSLSNWGIILASSSNSIEVGVLGSNEQAVWHQWNMNDESRAELPLTKDKQESYPIGLAFDTAAVHQLTFGENEVLPHMPMLHMLSHTGLLVSFNVINTNPTAPNVCTPPNYVTIPSHLMRFHSEILQEVTTEISAATTPSFASNSLNIEPRTPSLFQQPALMSTPVLPKPSGPFGLGGATVPAVATNLFGSKAFQTQPLTKDTSTILSIPVTALTYEPKQTPITDNLQLVQSQEEKAKHAQQTHKLNDNRTSVKPLDDKPIIQNLSKPAVPQSVSNSAKQEALRQMLIKEANDFQSDVFKSLIETCKVDTKIGNDDDIEEINKKLRELKLELTPINDLTELKSQVDDLKRDILQALSVLAEAKAQPNTQELHQIANLDPVSAKQQVSIKRLLYYVEGQVRLANQVLDQQWEAFQTDCKNKLKITGSDKMIRPSLETVYQPLVRQQEILSRQRSVLASLKQTIEATGLSVGHKPRGTLLKSKYLDKSDQTLSKLAKNILNMSLEPTDIITLKYKTVCDNYAKLTPSKLNELRNKFTNHRTICIKPTKVDTFTQDDLILNSTLPNEVSKDDTLQGRREECHLPKKDFEALKEDISIILDSDQKRTQMQARQVEAINQHNKNTAISSTYSDYINSQVSSHSFMGKTICSPIVASTSISSVQQPIASQFQNETSIPIDNKVKDFRAADSIFAMSTVINKTEQPSPDIQKLSTKSTANSSTPVMQAIHVPQPINKPLFPNFLSINASPSAAIQSVQPKSPGTDNISSRSLFSALSPPEADKQSKSATIPIINPIATTTSMKIVNQDTLINNGNTAVAISSVPSTNTKLSIQFSTNPSSAFIVPIPKSSSSYNAPSSAFSSLTSSVNSSKSIQQVIPTKSDSQSSDKTTKSTSSNAQSSFGITPVMPQTTLVKTIVSPVPVVSTELPVISSNSREIDGSSTTNADESNAPSISSSSSIVSRVEESLNPASVFSDAVKQSASSIATIVPSNTSVFSTTTVDTTIASIFANKSPFTSSSTLGSTVYSGDLNKQATSPTSIFGHNTPSSVFSSLTSSVNSSKSIQQVNPTKSDSQSSDQTTKSTSSNAQSGFGIAPVLPPKTLVKTIISPVPVVSTELPVISSNSREIDGSSTTNADESNAPSITSSPIVSRVEEILNPASVFSDAIKQSASSIATIVSSNTSVFSTTTVDTTIASIFANKSLVSSSSTLGSTVYSGDLNKQATSPTSIFGSPGFGTSNITTPTTSAAVGLEITNITPKTSATISLGGTFDSKSENVSTPAPLFGQPSTTSTNITSIFGVPSNTTMTATSIFGAAVKKPDNATSIFGTLNTATTTSSTLFGTPTSISTTASSIFGTPISTDSTVASIFGTPVISSVATTTSPLFASPTANANSIFGSPSNTAATSSIFGTPSVTSSNSDLGNNANTIASLFGGASISTSVTSSMNTFGSSGGSIFGGKPAFGESSSFGQSAGSIFGSPNNTPSFGQKNMFGNSDSNVGFGSLSTPSTQANIFGSPTGSAFTNTGSIFGSPQSQIFGSAQTGGSTFGSGSVFGGKPAFGQSSTFGSTLSSGGFGSFSANNDQSVAQTGFGSPSAFQKPQGAFGSPPSFGSPTQLNSGFGASPTFGTGPVFGTGSPVKSFGSTSQPPVGGFGTPTQQSSTFENLANQNTLTFGNLAQQTGQMPSQTGFQTSPSFSGWRG